MSSTERTSDGSAADGVERRRFLSTTSGVAMAGGLVGGYGMLAGLATRYAFPTEEAAEWLYVAPAAAIAPGDSMSFISPARVEVIITRQAESARAAPVPDSSDAPADPNSASAPAGPTAADYLALSSTCPHLGCRVHWESAGNRFFCPCHNGSFDPQGQPTGGPVLAANQALPRYELEVRGGLLFIKMPTASVGNS